MARRRRVKKLPRKTPGSSPDERVAMADAFEHLPDAIVIVDGTGNIVWGNRSAERLFERSLDDWQGQSGLDLVHPDDHELVCARLPASRTRTSARPSRSGSRRPRVGAWSRSSAPHVRWTGEHVVLLCLRDLTERRRFELASGREARFRSLVHNAGSVIMLVSPDGHHRVGLGRHDPAPRA